MSRAVAVIAVAVLVAVGVPVTGAHAAPPAEAMHTRSKLVLHTGRGCCGALRGRSMGPDFALASVTLGSYGFAQFEPWSLTDRDGSRLTGVITRNPITARTTLFVTNATGRYAGRTGTGSVSIETELLHPAGRLLFATMKLNLSGQR